VSFPVDSLPSSQIALASAFRPERAPPTPRAMLSALPALDASTHPVWTRLRCAGRWSLRAGCIGRRAGGCTPGHCADDSAAKDEQLKELSEEHRFLLTRAHLAHHEPKASEHPRPTASSPWSNRLVRDFCWPTRLPNDALYWTPGRTNVAFLKDAVGPRRWDSTKRLACDARPEPLKMEPPLVSNGGGRSPCGYCFQALACRVRRRNSHASSERVSSDLGMTSTKSKSASLGVTCV
jgi:hypothetical protein